MSLDTQLPKISNLIGLLTTATYYFLKDMPLHIVGIPARLPKLACRETSLDIRAPQITDNQVFRFHIWHIWLPRIEPWAEICEKRHITFGTVEIGQQPHRLSFPFSSQTSFSLPLTEEHLCTKTHYICVYSLALFWQSPYQEPRQQH